MYGLKLCYEWGLIFELVCGWTGLYLVRKTRTYIWFLVPPTIEKPWFLGKSTFYLRHEQMFCFVFTCSIQYYVMMLLIFYYVVYDWKKLSKKFKNNCWQSQNIVIQYNYIKQTTTKYDFLKILLR